jgi:hypothetical protein
LQVHEETSVWTELMLQDEKAFIPAPKKNVIVNKTLKINKHPLFMVAKLI